MREQAIARASPLSPAGPRCLQNKTRAGGQGHGLDAGGGRCYGHAPKRTASYVPPRKFSGAAVRRDGFRKPLILLVRAGRLELPRPYGQQILSLPRLPFRHARSSCALAQPSLGLILASAGPRSARLRRSLPLGLTRDKRSR